MALTIVTREQAGLPRVPSSIGHRSLSSWTGIKVHHTGGSFSSWLAVHEWQTEGRPENERLAYIGYSFGIANGQVTELRGFDHHPAHDHENSTLGMCFGGHFGSTLPTAADLAAFVEFVRLAREKTGRPLPISGHRDTWPPGDRRYSSCPGDRLYEELPALRARVEEDDVAYTERQMQAFPWQYAGGGMPGVPPRHSTLWVLGSIYSAVVGEDVAAASAAAARAAVREEFAVLGPQLAAELGDSEERVTAALRAVLGSLDEVEPE